MWISVIGGFFALKVCAAAPATGCKRQGKFLWKKCKGFAEKYNCFFGDMWYFYSKHPGAKSAFTVKEGMQ
jgi:hypothetical protein